MIAIQFWGNKYRKYHHHRCDIFKIWNSIINYIGTSSQGGYYWTTYRPFMRNLCLILPSSIIYLQGWQPYEMIREGCDMVAYNSWKEIIANKQGNKFLYIFQPTWHTRAHRLPSPFCSDIVDIAYHLICFLFMKNVSFIGWLCNLSTNV